MPIKLDPVDYDPFEVVPEQLQYEPVDHDPFAPQKTTPGDYSRSLALGLNRFGQTVGRAIDVVGNLDPTRLFTESGEGLVDRAGQNIEAFYKEREQEDYDALSPAMKDSMQLRYTEDTDKSWKDAPVENFKSLFAGDAWGSPSKVVGSLLQSAPSTVVGMGTGGMITHGLIKQGIKGLSPGMAGVIGGFIGEGGTASVESGKDVYDMVVDAPHDVLSQTEEYQKAWNGLEGEGMSSQAMDRQARELVADHAAMKTMAMVFGVTGALGSVSGHYMGKLIGGEAAGGLTRKIVTGGGTEALQETPQSGFEVFESNVQKRKYVNPEQDLWEGVKEGSVEGSVQGFVMGLGAGAGGSVAGKITKNTRQNLLDDEPQGDKGFAGETLDENGDIIEPGETPNPETAMGNGPAEESTASQPPPGSTGPTAEEAQWEADIRAQRDGTYRSPGVPIQALALGAQQQRQREMERQEALEQEALRQEQEALTAPGTHINQGQDEVDRGIAEFRRLKQQEEELRRIQAIRSGQTDEIRAQREQEQTEAQRGFPTPAFGQPRVIGDGPNQAPSEDQVGTMSDNEQTRSEEPTPISPAMAIGNREETPIPVQQPKTPGLSNFGKPSLQDEISEQPKHEAPQLADKAMQSHIDKRVESLGSIEAVDKEYGGKDKVSEYARTKAREVYSVKDEKTDVSERQSFDNMVKDAARWKGAAIKAEQAIPSNDRKSRLKHSKMTTKGDLDSYLMKKYGLNESEARDVSNELTRQNIPNDMAADLQDFKDEPWVPTAQDTIAPSGGTPEQVVKKGVQGKKGTTYLNDNTPIDFQYEVVELDDIITSHDLSMNINPNYPAELQPRDRSRKASIVQVEHMSKNLNPERLGENSSASDGAPIIGNDSNVVESGNGRILALNRAYQGKKGAEYRRWLEKNSGITGVDDFKIKNMKAPILVRRRTTQIDNLANYTQRANERQTAQLSSTEQAVVDAKNLTIEDISIFSPGEDGNINASNNQTFIKRFLGKMSPEERAGYTTEDGRSNRQLVDRIQSAIFQKAYNSDALLKMTAEEADPDIKNILNGLNASAGVFAKARGLDESLAGMSTIDDIVAGINLLRQAKSEYPEIKSGNGKSRIQNQIKQTLAQGDIFGKTNKPEVEQVALILAENIRSGKRIGEFIGNIGTMLKEYITDLPQMDLFGNKQKVTSADSIERSKKWLEEKYEDKQRDLFEVSQETDPGGKQIGDPNDSKKGDGAGEQSGYPGRTTDEVGGSEGEISEKFDGGLFDEKPKMPKQLDLFSAIPEPGRARQAGKKTKDSGSGPTNKRDVSSGLHHTVRVGVETTGNLEYHGLTAKSPGDIAALLSRLIKSPQEKLYTVSVDKQGVLIEVHAYAKGQRGSSSISPGEIAGRIFTHKNVHKAYYVHNHPSGATDPSPEDHESFTRLSNLLSLRKIKAEAIILGLSENSHESYRQFEKNLGIFGDEKHIPQTINQTSIPIKERVFLEQTPGKVFINSPRILESQLKKRPSGFLLVNSKNREVGYLELPVGIPKREMAALLLDASDKTNARSVFMYSKEGDINGRLKFFKDLGGAIALGDLNAYDMIFGDVNSGHVIHNQSFSSDLDIALSSVNSGESQFSTLPNPKDLYITHNLTEANLIHADKVGGLAVPSLAVSKVDKGGFDNFGEISLIADPSLIDPEKSAQNKVFNTDAYSPRYPEVTYKTDRANMSRLISDIDEVGPEIGKPYFDSDEVSRKGLEALYNDPSLMYRYLKSIGKAPKAKYETKPPIESYFKKFKQSKYSLENNKDFQDAVSRFYKEKLRTKDAKRISGLKEAWFNSDDGKVKYSLVREMATTVSKANGPKTIDSRAMSNVSRLKVSTKKTKADFRDWVTNNYHDVISGEQILNGFTYSGNKKYLPHDLDTVVKLMKKGLLDGEGFNYGVGSVRAVTSKQFKSIKDIQSDRDKIITSEEMEKIKKEVGDEFDELVSELKPYYKFDQDSFHYYNAASEALKDYAKKGVREFNETYENVPADLMKDVKEYLYKLKNLPTEYFEAKIQRAVGLDEFRYAIVPKGTKAATRQLLKKHGITVKTYDPKVRGDRDRVASGLKNVLFSTDKNQQDKPQVALPQIKKWFKGQSVGINPDGSTWVRIKNGAGLTIRNVKQVAEGKYLLSTESGKMDQNGLIAGKYSNNKIELVDGVATGKTLSHEVEHWLEDIGVITNLDKSVLDIAINNMAKKGEFDKLQDQRENRANFLSQYLADREQFRNRPIGRLLQKIADFLDAMVLLAKATVTGNAQSSVRKIARGVESGQIFSRDVNGDKGSDGQYSTVPTDQKENEKIVKSLFKQKKTFTESVKDMANKAKSEEERQLAKDKVIANTLDNLHFIKTRLGDRVYKMHRVLTGIKSATFARFLLDGPLSWVGDALQVVDKGKGVIPFLQSIGSDYQNLFLWIAARRAEQLEAEGREFWLTKDKRDAIDAKVGTHAKSGKSWESLNKLFQTINKNVLDIAEQAGLIDAEGRAMWESDFYIPFYRIFENEATKAEFLSGPVAANKHISAQIRRLKGSEAQIGDLLENSMTNWMHLIDAAARNKAKAAAFEVGVETGIFTELTKKDLVNVLGVHNETRYAVMKPDGKQASSIFDTKEEAEAWAYTLNDKYNKEYTVEPRKNTIIKFGSMKDLGVQSFQKDGKPVYFKTDDVDLYNSMCELDAKQFRSFIMKMFGGSKRLLTKGATFGTMFRINNAIRDTLHTSIVAGSFVPFVDTAIGFTKSWFETKEWREMMSSGFGFGSSYIHSDDPQAGSKYVRKIIAREGRGALSRILHSPGKILEVWEKIGTASENAARVQHYSRLRKKGISVFDAGFEARDLMDFSMRGGGDSIQLLTRTLPFLGARIQGNYKLGRAAKKNPVRFLLKGSMLTMASLALWGAFKDDDRYKELPDWDKFLFMHFWIGDKHFRIPAPFEVGVLFCSLPTTIANIVNGNEDMKFLGEWAKTSAGDVFGIDITPQLTKPLIELTTNKNTFTGRKIVPDYMEGLPKPEQYHHYTSETAREIGKRLNISPLQVEHLIRGYTSTMGMMALSALDDAFVRDLFDYPSRAKGEKKPWGVSRLVSDAKKPATSTKYLTGFYESAKQVADAKRTYNHYLKTAQLDKAADILKEKGLLMALSPATNKIKSRLALINDEMRRVQRSKEYTPSEKEKRLDVLMSERNRAVKAGFEGIRKAKAKQKVAG